MPGAGKTLSENSSPGVTVKTPLQVRPAFRSHGPKLILRRHFWYNRFYHYASKLSHHRKEHRRKVTYPRDASLTTLEFIGKCHKGLFVIKGGNDCKSSAPILSGQNSRKKLEEAMAIGDNDKHCEAIKSSAASSSWIISCSYKVYFMSDYHGKLLFSGNGNFIPLSSCIRFTGRHSLHLYL